jgi:hypothetical protein
MTKFKTLLLSILLFAFTVNAQTPSKKIKTKVFLLGVFHFNNPGLDLAKTKDTDILSSKSQAEIQSVVDIIAATRPEKIFFEAPLSYQNKMDSLYKTYLNGGLKSEKDETYQIGFRLMKKVGIKKSYCVDASGEFPADSLIKTWQVTGQQASFDSFMAFIKKMEDETNKRIENGLSIKERLRLDNTSEYKRMDMGMYSPKMMMTAGLKGNFIGADVTSEWYKRNIRIYSNILRELDGNEKCIFVMFGASHIPIIEHFFSLQDDYKLIDVASLLK